MKGDTWEIAIFGTFDVENYGDLLFPIIAEAELSERLGSVNLRPFSYHSKSTPGWPYNVQSLSELPDQIGVFDAALIGGGFIIRFDKEVAPGYAPADPNIHHPSGYWLTPALLAIKNDVQVIWNCPGMHRNEIPEWAEPLVRVALANSRYIAVRDETTRESLDAFVEADRISVVPDTAFGISRLLDLHNPSTSFDRLRKLSGLNDQYIIVQAARGLDDFVTFVKTFADDLSDFQFLLLPIGPILEDDVRLLGDVPGSVSLDFWPLPLELAELIGHAAAVVGPSYHLAVTAIACGVPVFSSADLSDGKHGTLLEYDAVYSLPNVIAEGTDSFLSRVGRKKTSETAEAAIDKLRQHWDTVADVVRKQEAGARASMNRFLQSTPGLIEAGYICADKLEQECRKRELRIDELYDLLALARSEIVARDEHIAALKESPSMRITSPLRFAMRALKRLMK